MSDLQEGSFKGHASCVKCDSSDGMAVYEKLDGDGNEFQDGFCYSCQSYIPPSKLGYDSLVFKQEESTKKMSSSERVEEIKGYPCRGVKSRKISREFAEMYHMRVGYNPETGKINEHYYPVTKDNKIVGYKVRKLPKDFYAVGSTKKAQLFGQWLFEEGGEYSSKASKKFLVITEGELDCIAMQQALSENGDSRFMNAVVSLPSGANSKAIKDNWEFVNKYSKIILVFDSDEPGKKAAEETAKALPMGKVSIATLPLKDPCDMLKAGRGKELAKTLWEAKDFSPAGIVSGADLWEEVSQPLADPDAYFPWDGLNDKLRGIMLNQIYTLTAGSGVAKTTFAKDIMHHLFHTTNENIGGIFIEEKPRKTARTMMGAYLKKLIHIPGSNVTQSELKEAFDNTLGTGRIFLYDGFGSNNIETIKETIIYYVKALGCRYIFLDHVSIMVSNGESDDERKELDKIMTTLATLVEELDFSLFLISHLNRPEKGKGHEEGGITSMRQLRGSGGIGHLSHNVIGFERNSQDSDPVVKNTTYVRVLKSRDTGESGIACKIWYNKDTGELIEIKDGEYVDPSDDSQPPWDEEKYDELY